jgi:arsenate reductase (thioredoxin)
MITRPKPPAPTLPTLLVPKHKVLFLCTGNSARSQMAEGLLRHLAGDKFEAMSAGTKPVGLNPLAVRAMRERGIDISSQRSKHVAEFEGHAIQFVITVCDNAREACPLFPGAIVSLHWGLPDPAAVSGADEQKLEAFRRVRDEVEARIKSELLGGRP